MLRETRHEEYYGYIILEENRLWNMQNIIMYQRL